MRWISSLGQTLIEERGSISAKETISVNMDSKSVLITLVALVFIGTVIEVRGELSPLRTKIL